MVHDKPDWGFVGIIIVVFAWLALCLYGLYSEHKDCEAKGGKMVKTGETIYYINSGSVLTPVITDEYECNK